ncbi:MAG: hypothetical protein IJ272_09380 [Clostridia bacterium]|nr:hypothetical protein [Clostridia bacterium]
MKEFFASILTATAVFVIITILTIMLADTIEKSKEQEVNITKIERTETGELITMVVNNETINYYYEY